MFPEKFLLLAALRFGATAICFLLWKFTDDKKQKEVFSFISVGSLLGLFLGNWDEIPVLYMVHEVEVIIASVFAVVVVLCGVGYHAAKSSQPETKSGSEG